MEVGKEGLQLPDRLRIQARGARGHYVAGTPYGALKASIALGGAAAAAAGLCGETSFAAADCTAKNWDPIARVSWIRCSR